MRYADNYLHPIEEFRFEDGRTKHVYTYTGPCVVTKKLYSVSIPANELFAYRQGEYIQTAMPSLSKDDREFLISGMSPEGWKQVFGPTAEEDEENERFEQDLCRFPILNDKGEWV